MINLQYDTISLDINAVSMPKKAMNRIKVVLVAKGKSQVWLAEQLGKSKYTVSRWCTNNVQPPLDVLFDIAKLLGVKVRDLIVEEGEEI